MVVTLLFNLDILYIIYSENGFKIRNMSKLKNIVVFIKFFCKFSAY